MAQGHHAGCVCTGCEYVAGGNPLDLAQADGARRRVAQGFASDLVTMNPHGAGVTYATVDVPVIPHNFPERPKIITETQLGDGVGGDSPGSALPGRFPAAGWDGEQNALSPFASRVGAL